MDDDDRLIGKILTRREVLAIAGLLIAGSGVGWGQVARGDTSSQLIVTPEMTEGPFFVDENLKRSDVTAGCSSPLVRHALPLNLQFAVSQLQGGQHSPLRGAHVDLWHCDAGGNYSDVADDHGHQGPPPPGFGPPPHHHSRPAGRGRPDQAFLRGYQITDKSGVANFQTVYPGWYEGRAVHIHFKIRVYSKVGKVTHEFTSQLFFDDRLSDLVFSQDPYSARGQGAMRNQDDGIYMEEGPDGAPLGSRLTLTLPRTPKNLKGTFAVTLQMP